MRSLPTVDVIVVNWNAGLRLRYCLGSLSSAIHEGYNLDRVVVVDNASTNDNLRDLGRAALPLVLIKNDSNRGFGAACNQGGAESKADYLLFLNPDTRVLDRTLADSVAWMESAGHEGTGILGVQLLDDNGQVARSCARFLQTRHFVSKMLALDKLAPAKFPDFLYVDWDHKESRQIEHVMGAYYLVRRSVFEQAGGFDERFFVYYEDVDLSLRALKAGWPSYYLATVQCHHTGGGTSSQIKARRLFYSLRSRIFYAFKNFTLGSAVTLLLMTVFVEPLSRLGMSMARLSLGQIFETLGAYALLWLNLPQILASGYLRSKEPVRRAKDQAPRSKAQAV